MVADEKDHYMMYYGQLQKDLEKTQHQLRQSMEQENQLREHISTKKFVKERREQSRIDDTRNQNEDFERLRKFREVEIQLQR